MPKYAAGLASAGSFKGQLYQPRMEVQVCTPTRGVDLAAASSVSDIKRCRAFALAVSSLQKHQCL